MTGATPLRWSVITPLLLLGTFVGCAPDTGTMKQSAEIKRATVTWLQPGSANPPGSTPTVVIEDRHEIHRLLSFMPGAGTGNYSRTAGHWEADVRIDLTKADGSVVPIFSNYRMWSEGPGERPAKAGFEQYLTSLLNSSNSKPPT